MSPLRRAALLCIAWVPFSVALFAGDLIVVRGPLPPNGAKEISKHASFYGDYGYVSIAEGSAGAAAELAEAGLDATDLGAWPTPDEVLVALEANVPTGAKVLLSNRGQAVFVSGTIHGDGCRCGHVVAHVERRAYEPDRGFSAPQPSQDKSLVVDARVAALVAQVSQTNLQATDTQLSSYFTRRADSAQVQTAKTWILGQLAMIPGLVVSTQTFNASYAPNIIAEIPGTVHPEKILVLGAHYDSINGGGSSLQAPGADDNATGSSAILECARILSQQNFEYTIRLMFYCAEELGLVGSNYDATQLKAQGKDVVAMLNMDMIAHLEAGDTYDLDFATNDTNAALTQFCRDVTAAYVPGFATKTGVLTAGTSDHKSYNSVGFPAAFFFEDLDKYSMVIHTANDVIGSSANNFLLARDIAKSFLATAALIAKPVDLAITHAPLADTTDGSGPYLFAANVTSLIGSQIAGVSLEYRVNGGSWSSKTMLPSGISGQYVASLPGLSPSGKIDYYLVATDVNGYSQYAPDTAETGLGTYGFSIGNGSTILSDDFDGASSGWTSVQVVSSNDWQIGPVNGESTDPPSAFSGSAVRGNDLGAGSFNGEYPANVENYLESPTINCAGKSNVHLSYRRWLGVEDGFYDQAKVEVNGSVVWQNPITPGGGTNHLIDTAWTAVDHDISAIAANNSAVKIRFRLKSDGGLQFGGWTLDDFRVYSQTPATTAALTTSEAFISQSQGGSAALSIAAGAGKAGRTYVVGLSVTGTAPSTSLGSAQIPLVFDAATNLGFSLLNTPVFQNFAGVLNGSGAASATLFLPPLNDPALAGLHLYFAAFTIAPVDYATNSVSVLLVP